MWIKGRLEVCQAAAPASWAGRCCRVFVLVAFAAQLRQLLQSLLFFILCLRGPGIGSVGDVPQDDFVPPWRLHDLPVCPSVLHRGVLFSSLLSLSNRSISPESFTSGKKNWIGINCDEIVMKRGCDVATFIWTWCPPLPQPPPNWLWNTVTLVTFRNWGKGSPG